MSDRLVCASCGEGFEPNADAFHATCPECGARYPARTGCC